MTVHSQRRGPHFLPRWYSSAELERKENFGVLGMRKPLLAREAFKTRGKRFEAATIEGSVFFNALFYTVSYGIVCASWR